MRYFVRETRVFGFVQKKTQKRGFFKEPWWVTHCFLTLFSGTNFSLTPTYRRRHEKTSYVLNYVFFTLLHKWVDRGQTYHFEKLQ